MSGFGTRLNEGTHLSASIDFFGSHPGSSPGSASSRTRSTGSRSGSTTATFARANCTMAPPASPPVLVLPAARGGGADRCARVGWVRAADGAPRRCPAPSRVELGNERERVRRPDRPATARLARRPNRVRSRRGAETRGGLPPPRGGIRPVRRSARSVAGIRGPLRQRRIGTQDRPRRVRLLRRAGRIRAGVRGDVGQPRPATTPRMAGPGTRRRGRLDGGSVPGRRRLQLRRTVPRAKELDVFQDEHGFHDFGPSRIESITEAVVGSERVEHARREYRQLPAFRSIHLDVPGSRVVLYGWNLSFEELTHYAEPLSLSSWTPRCSRR